MTLCTELSLTYPDDHESSVVHPVTVVVIVVLPVHYKDFGFVRRDIYCFSERLKSGLLCQSVMTVRPRQTVNVESVFSAWRINNFIGTQKGTYQRENKRIFRSTSITILQLTSKCESKTCLK